jgi:TonB-linked SusC/RagA family outer membrane protein
MKKTKTFHECGNHVLLKTLRIMRITLFLLLVSVLQTIANDAYSQKTRLSLNFSNTKLEDVLDEIEERSEFFFLYNEKLVNTNREVSFSFNNQRIDEILSSLFEGTDVVYSIADRKIILVPNYLSENVVQQQSVSGTVTDEDGLPLPGVTVLIKGTTQGTITNNDGEYQLTDIPEDATLQFSFVGMETQEVAVGDQSTIDITLAVGSIGIEEVVAIGYGTQSRQAVTGAVAVADLDKYREVPVNNVLETVKGTVAGLNVGATNTAGQVAGMSIRGQNSTSASNSPLVVVDGVIFNGSLGDIPSADIENFTVLKDASAAAVYGARSANGVILIETKKGGGISGKPTFNVNLSYGISDELKPLEVYGPDGYIQRILDIRRDRGEVADPNNIDDYLEVLERENYLATPNHEPTFSNPYNIVGRIGHKLNSTVSVSNSTAKSRYYISASVTDQKGVVLGDEYKHLSGRVNIESDLADWFKLGINSSYSLRDYSGFKVATGYGSQVSPWASFYNEDGSDRKYPNGTPQVVNYKFTIPNVDLDKRNSLNAVLSSTIKVPWVEGLSYNFNLSNSLRWNYQNTFWDKTTFNQGDAVGGKGNRAHNNYYNILADQIVKYKRTFAEKHSVDATLLYSYEENTWENLYGYAERFSNETLLDYALENGETQRVNTGGGESASIGQMARATYSYDRKYSLTGTVRRDGFSAFSKNKKWGVFSSIGANWNVSKESFMQNVDFIDRLAVRASYGSNGNQSIQPYSTLARIGTDKYVFAGDASYTITQSITSLALNNLGWETTTGLNIGIDFSVLNNRISGTIDAYKSKTEDLLFTLQLPKMSGASSILSNIGQIDNKGIELQLHTENMVKNDFQWSSDFAFSLNRNEVVSILGEDNDGDGVEDDLVSSGYFIGRSLGTIYTYKQIGIWQQEDEDNGTIMEGMKPGDYKIEDLPDENGELDGKITSANDRQFLGTSKSNFTWSWTNNFKYKDFSLMMYFYSIWGGNGYYQSAITPWNEFGYNETAMNNIKWDYWTPENTDAEFPRPVYRDTPIKANEYFDRSFIKLQKIALTYNLSRFVKSQGINDLRITASADNLYTYAPHWLGLDPETGQGLSNNSVPSIRTYLFTLAFNF